MFGDRSGCAKNTKSSMASPAYEIHDIMASGFDCDTMLAGRYMMIKPFQGVPKVSNSMVDLKLYFKEDAAPTSKFKEAVMEIWWAGDYKKRYDIMPQLNFNICTPLYVPNSFSES
ncbi:hypothetical protein Tco_0648606 [Tanacetum coccineum]